MEDVPETVQVVEQVMVEEETLDLEAGQIVTVPVAKKVIRYVPTGVTVRQLKPNYRFFAGRLYRASTYEDLDLEELSRPIPPLPGWVQQRLAPQPQQTASAEELRAEVEEIILAKAADPEHQDRLQRMQIAAFAGQSPETLIEAAAAGAQKEISAARGTKF